MTQEPTPSLQELVEGTPQATPEGNENNPSQVPSSGEEGEPSKQPTTPEEPKAEPNAEPTGEPEGEKKDAEKQPEAQVNPEDAETAIKEAKKKAKLAKDRFHENEKLKEENEQLRQQLEGKGVSIDESKISELVEQKFQAMNAKQQETALEKAEAEFYSKQGIRPGTELFQHLREKVEKSNPKDLQSMQETLRLHYRDYTYEQPTGGTASVPSVGGGATPTPTTNDSSAREVGKLLGVTDEDFDKYGK